MDMADGSKSLKDKASSSHEKTRSKGASKNPAAFNAPELDEASDGNDMSSNEQPDKALGDDAQASTIANKARHQPAKMPISLRESAMLSASMIARS